MYSLFTGYLYTTLAIPCHSLLSVVGYLPLFDQLCVGDDDYGALKY